MSRLKTKQRAVQLRGNGSSIKQIAKLLGVSQSSASLWVRGVAISKVGRDKLKQSQIDGRKKASETNTKKRLAREQKVVSNCNVLRRKLRISRDEAKLFLSLLYWGEGSKTTNRVVIMNSDPEMIKTFAGLLRKGFQIDERKVRGLLHLHSYHDRKKMIDFWSSCSGVEKNKIAIYNKQKSGIARKLDYKGCFAFRYGDVATLHEIMLIIERFKSAVYN